MISEDRKRLRIAVLTRVFSPTGGGAERYSIALVEHLAQRHEIHVFAQRIEHQWPGVIYHVVSSPLTRPRWINQLWYATATWWATRRGFDLVHSHENTWHGQVQTLHVAPVRYNLFHNLSGWRLPGRWFKVLTSPRLLSYLALEGVRLSSREDRCIVVTSKSLMAQVACTYPATANSLQVVTPGVTAVPGATTPAQQHAARQRLGLPALGRGVLFVGNDYRKKGLEALLCALGQLSQETWLVVVGNASPIPEFRAMARAHGVENRVYFLGPLNDVSDAYLAADCLAHPTLEDTFAMVVLEAMAHGLPVVVSSKRYCGISGLLTHEANALVLEDPRDPKALTTHLRRVLAAPSTVTRIREGALEFARLHQWTDIAMQQETIYFSLLRGVGLKS